MSDLGRALERLVSATFGTFRDTGGRVRAEALGQNDWASVTFSGAQHRLLIILDGPGAAGAAADFLAVMTEVELPITGHIVADVALLADARSDSGDHAWLELEVLTIEDG